MCTPSTSVDSSSRQVETEDGHDLLYGLCERS